MTGSTEARAVQTCPISKVVGLLGDPGGLGHTTHTIAAHMDYGPEILYRTRHRVIGTPYHRNAEGILALFRILASSDMDESRSVVDERGVDLLLVCPLHGWIYGAEGAQGSPETLHDRLVDGDPPDWLEEVPLPRELVGDLRLYEVRP